jgi:hypothetical protein
MNFRGNPVGLLQGNGILKGTSLRTAHFDLSALESVCPRQESKKVQ